MIEELCAYVMCFCVGGLVMAILIRTWHSGPTRERHRLEVEGLKRAHADQLSAVAGEQMRLRQWGPLSQRAPTIRG
jgi:hypothetical protein